MTSGLRVGTGEAGVPVFRLQCRGCSRLPVPGPRMGRTKMIAQSVQSGEGRIWEWLFWVSGMGEAYQG